MTKSYCRVCEVEREFEEIGVPSWGQSFERRIALTSGGRFGHLYACAECGVIVFIEGKTGYKPDRS